MADRSSYVSQKRHTRIQFTPLTWSCVLECLTPQSPVVQKMTLGGEVEPDRGVTPCIIRPTLQVYDKDGIMDTSGGNMLLSANVYTASSEYVQGHEWYVDGVEISSVWTSGTDYTIIYDTTSEYNGCLYVYKNIAVGESVSLQYRGVFTDTRLEKNRVVVSNKMTMTTIDAGTIEMALQVSPSIITYDPLQDKRLVSDYCAANDIDYTYTDDGKTYLREVSIAIIAGVEMQETVPTGYELQLAVRGGDAIDDPAEDVLGILSFSYPTMTLDLRCFDDTAYELRLVNSSGLVVARHGLDIVYQMARIQSVDVINLGDVGVNQGTYTNEVAIRTTKASVTYPELFFRVGYYTTPNTTGAVETLQGEGATLSVAVEDIGVGESGDEAAFDLRVRAVARSRCYALTDDDGNVLTDGDGNVLITDITEL